MSTKQQQLDEVRADILEKNVCPDLAQAATQLVFGDGNEDADVVLIGEAPGKQEDIKGKPFVGASGKFLDEMLETVGMKRSDVYITNIVKYRPPSNRDPLPEEKKEFMKYLQAQLDIIQPKLVVTLGRHSMNCFLPDLQISKVHGEANRIRVKRTRTGDPDQHGETAGSASWSDELIWVILPLYHPAAALYNGGMRQTLLDDFAKVPTLLKKITI